MENIKVSIVICHWKGNLIERCLKSLEKVNVNTQKIVISSDINFHYYPNVDIYHLGLNEPAYKRNWGAMIITREQYLVFLDDDTEISKHCIRRMYETLERHSEIGMIYATLYKMDNHEIIDTSGSFLSWNGFLYETYLKRPHELITPILSAKSACCMVRKSVFMQVGKFDQDYCIYGEETDLSWRVWQAGYRVVIRNDAVAYHAFETPLKPKSYYNPYYIHYHGCKNYITTLLKNLPSNRLYIALLNAGIWFIMGLAMLFKNRQAGIWIFQGIWYNIKNFKYIWRKRQEIQKTADHSYWKLIYKSPPLSYYFQRFSEYWWHQLHS